jgi:sucrose-phosphate synthase
MVFSIARLDHKKNLISLVKAFAYDKELQEKCNLVIVTGRIGKMGKSQQFLMNEMTDLIKKKKLSEKVCIVRHIDYQKEGGEIYRIARDTKGVFVNPALHEPFGITVIEAGAVGMPVIATNSGGPVESIGKCKHGVTIDPRDTKEIADSLKKIIFNQKLWKKYSENGKKNVRLYYTWDATAKTEYDVFKKLV